MKYEPGTFTTVPNTQYFERIQKSQGVFVCICKHADEHGRCYPAYTTIRKFTGIGSNSTIKLRLDELVEHGFIEVTSGKKRRNVNEYQILIIPDSTVSTPDSTVSNSDSTVSVDKLKITKQLNTRDKNVQVQKGIEVCTQLNPLAAQSWYGNTTQRKNAEIIAGLADKNDDKLKFIISKAIEHRAEQYFPKVNSPYDLVNKLQKVQDALKERGVFYKQVDTTIEDDAEELGYSIDG